jgi:nucleotidyltransferase substrate binding protein (TIGR01987 family)
MNVRSTHTCLGGTMKSNIRWQQRFSNFTKVFERLTRAVQRETYDELEEAGLIQIFEFTFELGWKVLKDFLEAQGYDDKTPREVIKRGFQLGYIKDGKNWLDALDKRNLMTHTYDENKAKEAVGLIKNQYFKILEDFHHVFNEQQKSH